MSPRLARLLGSLAVVTGVLALYFTSAIAAMLVTGSAVAGAGVAALVVLVAFFVHRRLTTGSVLAAGMLPAAGHPAFLPLVLGGLLACWMAGQTFAVWLSSWVHSPGWEAAVEQRAATPVWLLLLTALVLAPAGEEALIRGIVYTRLRMHLPVLVSALASAGLFAALHGNLVQVVATLPLGVLLALVYEATGRLWVVIGLHMVFNVLAVLVPVSLVAAASSLLGVVLSVILAAGAIYALHLLISTTGTRAAQPEPTPDLR